MPQVRDVLKWLEAGTITEDSHICATVFNMTESADRVITGMSARDGNLYVSVPVRERSILDRILGRQI